MGLFYNNYLSHREIVPLIHLKRTQRSLWN